MFLLVHVDSYRLLLSQYRYKMGRIKYFSLLCIPLIYYIFPFENYFGNAFYPLLPSSPLFISLLYIIIFSATKQVGALVFSLVFWTASSLVYKRSNSHFPSSHVHGHSNPLRFPGYSTITISRLSTLWAYHRGIYTTRNIPNFCWDFYLSQEHIDRYGSKERVLQQCL